MRRKARPRRELLGASRGIPTGTRPLGSIRQHPYPDDHEDCTRSPVLDLAHIPEEERVTGFTGAISTKLGTRTRRPPTRVAGEDPSHSDCRFPTTTEVRLRRQIPTPLRPPRFPRRGADDPGRNFQLALCLPGKRVALLLCVALTSHGSELNSITNRKNARLQ